MSTSTLLL